MKGLDFTVSVPELPSVLFRLGYDTLDRDRAQEVWVLVEFHLVVLSIKNKKLGKVLYAKVVYLR